ncbi:MAG: HD-like signal output (HDOD) protein [Psychroserpens sp.]|jgi:HD-like signal output (HDOD) protein
MMNVNDYAQKTSEIFVFSDSFVSIKEWFDNEDSTIDDIADVIIFDPVLTVTI